MSDPIWQWVKPTLSESSAIFWAQKAITDYRDGGGETRILVDFHSAPTGLRPLHWRPLVVLGRGPQASPRRDNKFCSHSAGHHLISYNFS